MGARSSLAGTPVWAELPVLSARETCANQAAFAAQEHAAMSDAGPDEMVLAMTVIGSADEVRERVAERAESAGSITPVVPQFGVEPAKASLSPAHCQRFLPLNRIE